MDAEVHKAQTIKATLDLYNSVVRKLGYIEYEIAVKKRPNMLETFVVYKRLPNRVRRKAICENYDIDAALMALCKDKGVAFFDVMNEVLMAKPTKI